MRLLCRIIVPMLMALLLHACKSVKTLPASDGMSALSAREVLERSALNRHFGELSSKVNISYEIGSEKQGFSARVRMKQDSIIWVSVAPLLGIEIVRAVITADSLKLVDRFNRRFYLGRFDRLNQMLGVDLDFAKLQSLITGNNIELYAMERYESRLDGSIYRVGTLSSVRREGRKGAETAGIGQETWIEPVNFSVVRSVITDLKTQSTLEAVYSAPRPLGKVHFPEKMTFDVKGKQPAKVEMQWSKPALEAGQEFPFSIPAGYDEIK